MSYVYCHQAQWEALFAISCLFSMSVAQAARLFRARRGGKRLRLDAFAEFVSGRSAHVGPLDGDLEVEI